MDDSKQSEIDRKWMLRAIDISKKCKGTRIYSTGCLIINSRNVEAASGYTGEAPYPGKLATSPHAEELALQKIKPGQDFTGWTLYTSLEPCSQRLSEHETCTSRIIKSGIKRVVFGLKEPTDVRLNIQCRGAEMLREAGIEVVHFVELEDMCRRAVKRADS